MESKNRCIIEKLSELDQTLQTISNSQLGSAVEAGLLDFKPRLRMTIDGEYGRISVDLGKFLE